MANSNKTKTDANTGAAATTAAMMAFNPAAAKAWPDIMSETARFLTDRLQQDLNTQKAMLACKSPVELMQLQTEFFTLALEQYTNFATHLSTKMSAAVDDADKDARSGHSRKYDDIPL